MKKLSSPIIGLITLQRNHTHLDLRQGILNVPYFSLQLKTADHKNSNVIEPILSPEDVIYVEDAVTVILQPSDFLHEEDNYTFAP